MSSQVPTSSLPPASTPNAAAAAAVAQPNEDELTRLSHLHRMSRTAGLGSSEYSAINTVAVVAALIGGASSLALFSSVLLVLPVVGVIISVIAIRQIRQSNGTQTGMALAVLGLVASISFAGFTGLKYYQAEQVRAQDSDDLIALTADFGKLLSEGNIDGAYKLTDARFQEQVKPDTFQKFFSEKLVPAMGNVTGVESNGLFAIEQDPENPDIRLAQGRSKVKTVTLPEGFPADMRYRRTADRWQIIGLPPEWFAPPGAQPGAGAPAGPPGM